MAKCLVLLSLLFICVTALAADQPATVNEWLDRAGQAEDRGDFGAAFAAYSAALSLRPDDAILNLKAGECLIFAGRNAEAAKLLLRAFDQLQANPKTPNDLKKYACSMLMGRMLDEWYGDGRIYPIPLATLPKTEQIRIIQAVPKEWLFTDRAQEAFFRMSMGETQTGTALLKQAVMAGGWEKVECPIFARVLKPDQRQALLKAWLADAKKTNNSYLWLAVLDSYWQAQLIPEFEKNFPSALAALKKQPTSLKALYSLCSRMRWQKGIQEIKPLLPFETQPQNADQTLEALNNALTAKDRARVMELILKMAADFPDEFYRVYEPKCLRLILASGWSDLVEKVMQKDLIRFMPQDSKNMLLGDSAYNVADFDHWMRLFISDNRDRALDNLFAAAQSITDAERGIWMLEQGMRIFPKDITIKTQLGAKLFESGYLERAIAVAQETLWEKNANGEDCAEDINTLWNASKKLERTGQVFDTVWNERDKLALGTCVVIANCWYANKQPEQAAKWCEYAVAKSESKGWSSDAAIQAEAYRLQSNDPFSSQALELNARTKRTAGLYTPETYELRLRYLIDTNKTDDVAKIYSEAKKLYPEISFTDVVNKLQLFIAMDWNEEVKRLSDQLLTLSQPVSSDPFWNTMTRLAYALVKASRADEASALAPKVLPTRPDWQKGLPLAVDLFSKRFDCLLPFVEWSRSVSNSKPDSWEESPNRLDFAHAIATAGDPSLACAFSITRLFFIPIGAGWNGIYSPISDDEDIYSWRSMSSADKSSQLSLLSGIRLNTEILASCLSVQQKDESWYKFMVDLMLTQKSAAGLVESIHLTADGSTGESDAQRHTKIAQMLDMLAQAKDWDGVGWFYIKSYTKTLTDNGFRDEAVRMLQLLLPHAPEDRKIRLQDSLSKLTGENPPPVRSAAEKTSAQWIKEADSYASIDNKVEASRAYMKALDTAQSGRERLGIINRLSSVDPAAAIEQVEKNMSSFTVVDPKSGEYSDVYNVSGILTNIARTNNDLAPKILPLLNRLADISPEVKTRTTMYHAMVCLFAGNIITGKKELIDLQNGDVGPLITIFHVVLDMKVPDDARRQVMEELKKYIAEKQVGMSIIVWAMWRGLVFGTGLDAVKVKCSSETISEFSDFLNGYLDQSNAAISEKFLEIAVQWTCHLSWYDEDCAMVWVPLVEKAYHKAAQPPADPAALADMLRKQVDGYYRSDKWPDRPSLKRLAALIDSLKGEKK
ncbi:MAG: tetratricopeptide repeat protein [Armatimonadota bacterium]